MLRPGEGSRGNFRPQLLNTQTILTYMAGCVQDSARPQSCHAADSVQRLKIVVRVKHCNHRSVMQRQHAICTYQHLCIADYASGGRHRSFRGLARFMILRKLGARTIPDMAIPPYLGHTSASLSTECIQIRFPETCLLARTQRSCLYPNTTAHRTINIVGILYL